MASLEPCQQPVEVQVCIPDGYIAKHRARSKHFNQRMPQKEDECGAIIDLRARRTQSDIGIYVNKFLSHSTLKRERQSNCVPFILGLVTGLRRFFDGLRSFLGSQLRAETAPGHAERKLTA